MRSTLRFLSCVAGLLTACSVTNSATAQPKAVKEKPHLALVSTEKNPAIENILLLTEAKLSADDTIQLLDRKTVDRVLAEQKLSLAGFVKHDQVVKAGQLLGVNLFAVLETDIAKKKVLGLVVFDAVTGVRLWDKTLADPGLDKAVENVTKGVKAAIGKYRGLDKNIKTVSVTAIRNVDLPRDKDSLFYTAGFLIERALVDSPGVALLERTRLAQVVKERNLPTNSPLKQLLASVLRIELQFQRGESKNEVLATAFLYDSAGKKLAQKSARTSTTDAVKLAQVLLPGLTKMLKVSPNRESGDPTKEALRFAREADYYYFHRDQARELRAREAAVALNPKDIMQRWKLTLSLRVNANAILYPRGIEKKLPSNEEIARFLSLFLRAVNEEEKIESAWRKDPSVIPGPHPVFSLGTLARKKQQWAKVQSRETEDLWNQLLVANERLITVRFHQAFASIGNKKAFNELTQSLSGHGFVSLEDELGLPPGTLRKFREKHLTRWLKLAERFGTPPGSENAARAMYDVLRIAKQKAISLPRVAAYRKKLRDTHHPLIRLNERLLDLRLEFASKNFPPAERFKRVRQFRFFVQKLLESAEGERSLKLRGACYNAFLTIIHASPRYSGMTFNYPLGREVSALGQFMVEHHDFHYGLATYLHTFMSRTKTRAVEAKALSYIEALSQLQDSPKCRFLVADPKYGSAKSQIKAMRQQLVRRKREILTRYPDLAAIRVNPWGEIREFIDVLGAKSGIMRLAKPVVHKDSVYVVALGQEGPQPSTRYIQLVRFSLAKGKPVFLGKIRVDTGYTPLPEKVRAFYAGYPRFGERDLIPFATVACIEGKHYILGTRDKGVFLFSLDGDKVQRLNTGNHLPSNGVQSLTCVGDQLFLFLGAINAEGNFLVVHNLKTEKTSLVVSSRRAAAQSPLDSNPGLRVFRMLNDPPRQRVLFVVDIKSRIHSGIWAIDIKTHKLRQVQSALVTTNGWISPPQGGKVVFAGFQKVFLLNLASGKSKSIRLKNLGNPLTLNLRLPEVLTLITPEKSIKELLPNHFFHDGWLWSASTFSRISVKNQTKQFLTSLRRKSKSPFYPHEVFQLIGTNRMLLGDAHGLWLATLRKK